MNDVHTRIVVCC